MEKIRWSKRWDVSISGHSHHKKNNDLFQDNAYGYTRFGKSISQENSSDGSYFQVYQYLCAHIPPWNRHPLQWLWSLSTIAHHCPLLVWAHSIFLHCCFQYQHLICFLSISRLQIISSHWKLSSPPSLISGSVFENLLEISFSFVVNVCSFAVTCPPHFTQSYGYHEKNFKSLLERSSP